MWLTLPNNSKELDPYTKGLPADIEKQLADKYGSLFKLFMKYEQHIDRVTFWGLSDRNTWLNNWPIRGRTNYPLPFNRDLSAKPEVFKVNFNSGRQVSTVQFKITALLFLRHHVTPKQ